MDNPPAAGQIFITLVISGSPGPESRR